MTEFNIAIRKEMENETVKHWLLISAEPTYVDSSSSISSRNKVSFVNIISQFFLSLYWMLIIVFTIFLNTFLYISDAWIPQCSYQVIITVHVCCFFYWVDFFSRVIRCIYRSTTFKTRLTIYLTMDAISLLPLSAIYLIIVHDYQKIDLPLLRLLRSITLIRVYRVFQCFHHFSSGGKNCFQVLIASYSCFVILFSVVMSNIFLNNYEGYSEINIKHWNATNYNKVIVSLHYTVQMVLNVGFGDIMPLWYSQIVLSGLGMAVGATLNVLVAGILGVMFTRSAEKRENYRYEYEAIKNTLKARKIDPKVTKNILDNMSFLWKYKKGLQGPPPVHILPLSMRREIYFDINFGLLSHSLIFSTQPRSFLRSVTIFMHNVSYLPGDIILEPGVAETMICVASGVIEILSQQNDDSTLLSLTNGSIIGEAALFFPIPIQCIIRASTYVELQVLKKVHFTRLALTYPKTFRSMRKEILQRFELKQSDDYMTYPEAMTFKKLKRRETRRFLQNLKNVGKDDKSKINGPFVLDIMALYVPSENIPKVKTLPITLIRTSPWILRPDTSLTKFWACVVFPTVTFACIVYPICVSFNRKWEPWMYIGFFLTRAVYLIDVYVECTTAIECKNHYTFKCKLKDIVAYKLTTFGFYLDVLSAYYLSIYGSLIWPGADEYGYFLLSLNVLLKSWRLIKYMKELENNMSSNLFFVVMFKYVLWVVFVVIWGAMVFYVEARPWSTYLDNRWYGAMRANEAEDPNAVPRSKMSPAIVTVYYASVTIFALGCGDIAPAGIADCLITVISIILGFIFLMALAGEVASVTRHMARIKTNYQEEHYGVDRFIAEHEISKDCSVRLNNYFRLQWNYDRGYSLKQVSMSSVSMLQRRIITMEVTNAFLTVPIFRNCPFGFLKQLANLCQIRVLPPNEMITEKNSYYRQMYILESGYCQVSESEDEPPKVISPPNPFGYLEMIKGEPQRLRVVTLTHVRVVSLHYSSFFKATTKYPGVRLKIKEELEKNRKTEKRTTGFEAYPDSIESLYTIDIQKQVLSKPIVNLLKYHKTISESYWEPFSNWGKYKFFCIFFLPLSITPDSMFMKVWMSVRTISGSVIAFVAPLQFSILADTHWCMKLIITLQILSAIDMYLMFHVAYYDNRGILMFHPAKTSTNYFKSSFVLDLIIIFPYHWILKSMYSYGDSIESLSRFCGFIMTLHLYRVFQACKYFENEILRKTDILKILKLLFFVFSLINIVAGIIIINQCRNVREKKELGLTGKTRLAHELNDSFILFCLQDRRNESLHTAGIYKLYLTTTYWVAQTVTVCGFGDIIASTEGFMIWVIILTILGIFFFTIMFANVTSSMVNTTVAISQYRMQIIQMVKFMKKKKVNDPLQKRFTLHYQYNWRRTEGANPQMIFSFIHDALKEKIVASMYEATLSQNPVFEGFEKQILTAFGNHFMELYFLQGESIIKYKDILDVIYLIYRGKVQVISPEGQIKLEMGKGSFFGNISNKPFYLSPATFVAAEHLDLVKLDSKKFFSDLLSLPSSEPLIEKLTRSKDNYIPSRRENQQTRGSEFTKINNYRLHSVAHNQGGNSAETQINSGSFLVFRDMILCLPTNRFSTYIILPDSNLEYVLDLIFTTMAVLSYSLTLYMFSFQDSSVQVMIFSYFLDLLFVVEIYLQFHMTQVDRYGDCVINKNIIIKRYIKSKKFVFDILSNLPLEFFLFFISLLNFKTFSILRLNRLLRICFLIWFYNKQRKKLMNNKVYIQLGWVLIVVALMIHTLGCIWYFSVCPLNYCSIPSWISDMDLVEVLKEKWEVYIYSVFQIVLTTSSTGLQAIPIYSVQEIVLINVFMLVCRYAIVIFSGLVLATLNAQNLYTLRFHDRVSTLIETFKYQNISKYPLSKMKKYLERLWTQEDGSQIPEFISKAPYTMKCEIMTEMFGSHLYQSYIFSNTQPQFLNQLASHFKRYVYFPANYIVQQGDIDYTMYFINEGEVSVLTIHPELMETIHFKLIKNDHFGTKQGLDIEKAHTFTYRAETYVEILSLTLNDWRHLLKYFPSDAAMIYHNLDSLP